MTSGRGRFCGLHLHAWNPNPLGRRRRGLETGGLPFRIADTLKQAAMRWDWGEGDEKFFVDGERTPSTFGTGTHGYFGRGHGPESLSEVASALQNQPLSRNGALGHVSSSRLHIADSVPFQRRFEGVLEKYHPNSWPLLYE